MRFNKYLFYAHTQRKEHQSKGRCVNYECCFNMCNVLFFLPLHSLGAVFCFRSLASLGEGEKKPTAMSTIEGGRKSRPHLTARCCDGAAVEPRAECIKASLPAPSLGVRRRGQTFIRPGCCVRSCPWPSLRNRHGGGVPESPASWLQRGRSIDPPSASLQLGCFQ